MKQFEPILMHCAVQEKILMRTTGKTEQKEKQKNKNVMKTHDTTNISPIHIVQLNK